MAYIQNLVIDQGATFSTSVTVTDAEGDALNLTSYLLRGQMRKSYASSSYTSFTAVSATPTSGVIDISLTATQTGELKAGRYVYDLEIEDTAGVVTRIVEGIITVTPQVTR